MTATDAPISPFGALSQLPPDLPVHLTGFIGRDPELVELKRLIQSTRMLTLTGAGGSGKTRLARELAVRSSMAFDRIGWVDLAPISNDPAGMRTIVTPLFVVMVGNTSTADGDVPFCPQPATQTSASPRRSAFISASPRAARARPPSSAACTSGRRWSRAPSDCAPWRRRRTRSSRAPRRRETRATGRAGSCP